MSARCSALPSTGSARSDFGMKSSGVKGVKNALIAFSNGQPNASYLVGPDLYDEESQLYHQPVDLILFLRGD